MPQAHIWANVALSGIAATILPFGTAPALAQQAAPTAPVPTNASNSLSEVIVTARRRAERLQDVPLAITAITSSTLRETGVTDLRGVLSLTPGVTIDETSAEANAVPVIRGEYNLNNAPGSGGQPNVAVFLDGIYIQNTNAISLGLMDIDRVEVVKGPVSALYGRNGFAGAINYVSKTPTDTFHSSGSFQAEEDSSYNVLADVNGPAIAGMLRFGAAVNYQTSDGFYKDPVTDVRAGGYEKRDFKGTFNFTPMSKLTINGGYYYGDDHFDQAPIVNAAPNCADGLAVCGKYVAIPVEVAAIPASSGNSGNNRTVQLANLRADYDLGWSDVLYLGGYDRVVERSYQDFTGLRNGLTYQLTPGPGTANVYELFGADDDTEDFSQEIRLSSKQDTRFRWSLGGDYFQTLNENTTLIGENGAQIPAGQSISSAANFYLAGLFVTPNGGPSASNLTATATREETASGFGSFEYDILRKLTVSLELRYTNDHQALDIQRNAFIANVEEPYGPVPSINFGYLNYRTTLKYRLTPVTILYASAASGTKAGGYNGRATIPSELAYQPETNTTYEVGGKSSFLQNSLQLDVAVYHIDSSGLQINGPSSDPQNIGQVVKNFGGTTNTGFEFTAIYEPIRRLVFSAGFAYTDPVFTSGTTDVNGVAYCSLVPSCAGRVITVQAAQGPTPTVNLKGLQLEESSKYQLNLTADYRRPLFGDIDGIAHADYRFESRQYQGLEDLYYLSGRNLLNLRVGLAKGPVEGVVFVDNVLDDRTPVYPTVATELNDFHSQFEANLPDPRLVGVQLNYHF